MERGSVAGELGEIAPDGLRGGRADGNDALLGAFAVDEDASVLEVGVVDGQVTELAGVDACVEEEQDDGPIAGDGGAGVAAFTLARLCVWARAVV